VLDYPVLLLFPAAMLYAAVSDIFTMTIPNRISIALIAIFPLAAYLAGLPMATVLWHLAAFATVLVVCFGLFSFNLLGGGDAKLLASAALWVGMSQLLPFITYVALSGGALAIIFLAYRRFPVSALPVPEWALRLHKAEKGMPYGLAICVGGLLIFPKTEIFKAMIV
jgi:prepilin peptidase CpaA